MGKINELWRSGNKIGRRRKEKLAKGLLGGILKQKKGISGNLFFSGEKWKGEGAKWMGGKIRRKGKAFTAGWMEIDIKKNWNKEIMEKLLSIRSIEKQRKMEER